MTQDALASALAIAAPAAMGLLAGFAYFAALGRTVALFASGGGWLGPAALTLGRLIAATAFFALAARLGPAPLLAAFTGFLAARTIMLRRVRRTG